MFDARQWAHAMTKALLDAFGDRLLFTGLQGSHRRGEAGENSDIDLVVIIDGMTMDDLARYRDIVDAMPHREKACGFVGGKAELKAWPRHEIFQFGRDTEALHGRLDDLLPEVRREDIAESVLVGASGLYHMLCHTYVHGGAEARAEAAKGARKGAFFILQAAHYLRTGDYVDSKAALAGRLSGDERLILEPGVGGRDDVDADIGMLLHWCSALLDEFSGS